MKDAETHIRSMLPRIKKHGCVLMLDFDGVLAPIVTHPAMAHMPRRTHSLLAACALRFRVVIISGRALSDVRSRVRLPGLWYAGNHGAEWRMGKERGREKPALAAGVKLREARDAFIRLSRRYQGVLVEDKELTVSVHFRGLARSQVAQFKRDIKPLDKKFKRFLNIAEGDQWIYNVRPRKSRTKGDAVRLARACAPSKAVPIYIGDDATDEDAFRAIPQGITIRVSKRRGSAARFFVRTRDDVDMILQMLASS